MFAPGTRMDEPGLLAQQAFEGSGVATHNRIGGCFESRFGNQSVNMLTEFLPAFKTVRPRDHELRAGDGALLIAVQQSALGKFCDFF